MQFVADWVSDDRRVLLSFADSVLEVFAAFRQVSAAAPEAGGILLGTVHGRSLLIAEATAPTPRDRRSRFLFDRSPFGHRHIAARRWRSSAGTVRYLGEWHTHPQGTPSPSGIDRQEWGMLVRKRQDARPMLAVIVGRDSLHVELVLATGHGDVLKALR